MVRNFWSGLKIGKVKLGNKEVGWRRRRNRWEVGESKVEGGGKRGRRMEAKRGRERDGESLTKAS